MINSEDISVVVQGAIDKKLTQKCLKSVRKFLPKAQIILSTWEDSIVEGLNYDILVLNKDPGYEICEDIHKIKNNTNRQIVSTQNGLKKVATQYTLKIRSDMCITNCNFLQAFEKFNNIKRSDDLKITKSRIVINNLYCSDPKDSNKPFHISDWFQFGLTEDVSNLWDIPLQEEPFNSRYFTFNKKNTEKLDKSPLGLHRYTPEQYVTLSFIKKNNYNVTLDYYFDCNEKNIEQTYQFYANNFIILDYQKCGIKFLKYDPYKHGIDDQMTFLKWITIYKTYCDPEYYIPLIYSWKRDLHLCEAIHKLKKHCKRFIGAFKSIINTIFEFLSIMYYVLKIIFNIIFFMPNLILKLLKPHSLHQAPLIKLRSK